MQRIALGVEYLGTNYFGLQAQQSNIPTIQAELEKALSSIAASPIRISFAGRTDKGVHALNQVIHFDSEAKRSQLAWIRGVNSLLPADISIKWAMNVPKEFHSRFSALSRSYLYVIDNSQEKPAIFNNKVAWFYKPLDISTMQTALQEFIGEHDFSAVRGPSCQAKSPIKKVKSASIVKKGNYLILTIKANGFLHHMVRNIVGVLLEVGIGKRPTSWPCELLAGKLRAKAGVTAPACGLYFCNAEYHDELGIPKISLDALKWRAI